MISTENQFIRLEIEPETGSFSMLPIDALQPGIENAQLRVEYRVNGRLMIHSLSSWQGSGTWERIEIPNIGPCQWQIFSDMSNPDCVIAEIEFALLDDKPLLLWKIKLTHNGIHPIQVERLVALHANGRLKSGKIKLAGVDRSQLGFYSNGWQSWSHTGCFHASESLPQSRLGIFQNPMVTNPGTPAVEKRGYFSSDMFAVLIDRKNRTGLLTGFLSQLNHFGSIEASYAETPSLGVWANGDSTILIPGQSMETDWAVLFPFSLDKDNALDEYLDAVAQYHNIQGSEVLAGWCSWYYYYTKLSSMDVKENLDQIAELSNQVPLQLVQIDDGYEAAVGDWFGFRSEFPNGVAPLAHAIKKQGNIPGLWLAPFIVHPRSKLYHEHPEWLLRNRSGRLARAGFVWNSFPAALDLTVPDALDYASRVISTAVHEWGFTYLKLDFLYAAALKGTYRDPGRTRAQVLRQGMEAIRKSAGADTYLLGCGLPIGSGLGLVQSMRVSADVGGSWSPSYFHIQAPFQSELRMPSARNAIHNSITRAPLHNKW